MGTGQDDLSLTFAMLPFQKCVMPSFTVTYPVLEPKLEQDGTSRNSDDNASWAEMDFWGRAPGLLHVGYTADME